MNPFLAFLAHLVAAPAEAGADPGRQLMEKADARAGLNPGQARELRAAAQAWLSVVR